VVGADGSQLGVIPTADALKQAQEAGLDLVEVAPTAKPPVCRIMDYGKFKYQQNKKAAKSHGHQIKLKEIRLRPKTGDHDVEFKIKQARTFLEHKDKVQITVVFKGRENAHIDEGKKVIEEFIAQLMDIGKLEHNISFQARKFIATVSPK
jgi:translation initiation factor IF-3